MQSIYYCFQEKATLFDNFFVSQCTVLGTGSVFPLFRATTDNILDKILFNDRDIITHIRSLYPNKAHGCDGITIQMIQICDDALVFPLSLIYSNWIEKDVIPKLWKMANVVPVYKKAVNS